MEYECRVRDQEPQRTLSMRTRTPVQGVPGFIGKAYAAIGAYLAELKKEPVYPVFAAYYNMDMQDLDTEAGFGVAEALPGRGEIQAGEIPGGKVAYCLHVGPYDKVGAAYDALMRFMAEQGLHATGVAYEYYLDDPQVTGKDPHTEVIFPLKAG